MKPSKSALPFAVLVLFVAANASAQAADQAGLEKLKGSTPEQRAKIQDELMAAKLQLSAQQAPQVQAINLEYAQKMEPVIQGSEGPLVKLRSAKAIDQQKDAALQGVLSGEQFQKYLAAKQELRQKLEERVAAKRGGSQGPGY
jgi:hypothetical protein